MRLCRCSEAQAAPISASCYMIACFDARVASIAAMLSATFDDAAHGAKLFIYHAISRAGLIARSLIMLLRSADGVGACSKKPLSYRIYSHRNNRRCRAADIGFSRCRCSVRHALSTIFRLVFRAAFHAYMRQRLKISQIPVISWRVFWHRSADNVAVIYGRRAWRACANDKPSQPNAQ